MQNYDYLISFLRSQFIARFILWTVSILLSML